MATNTEWTIASVIPRDEEKGKGVIAMTVLKRGATVIAVADGRRGHVGVAHVVARKRDASDEARDRAASRLFGLRQAAYAARKDDPS